MALNIRRGPTQEPIRLLLHGVSGIGKTTFAAAIPDVVFVTAEDGGGDLDIARLPIDTWAGLTRELTALLNEDHSFTTVVLDTISTMERLCWAHLCAEGKCATIDEVAGGYGKGYTAAVTEQERVIALLDTLRAKRRMNVVALCHTIIKKFDDPRGIPYDRYQLGMNEKAAKLWLGWADDVLFANYEVRVKVDGNAATAKKGKARDEAADRTLYTETRPAFDAKNRHSLPPDLALDWTEFSAAIRWDARTAAARGGPPVLPTPSVAELRNEAKIALRERDWINEDIAALLKEHGATTFDTLPESARGIVMVTLRESRSHIDRTGAK